MTFSNAPLVALVRCASYDPEEVHAAVGRGLELLGGIATLCQPGERLLLKPNLLIGTPPEGAVTTHPAVFGAVARHLLAAGAQLTYGDSPGVGRPSAAASRSQLTPVAQALGLAEGDLETPETVSFPEGRLIKQFTVARGALAVDGIVSLPKFKTHGLTRMTGAIKNQFGCVPGVLKAEWHTRLADQEQFSQMLVDLNRLLRPRLCIMDAIVGMEGNGPRGGDPRAVNALLLSTDPVALDATVCRMMHLDPDLAPTVRWGHTWGLGNAHEVDVRGEALADYVMTDYVVNRSPASTTGGRGLFSKLARQLVVPRPVIVPAECTRCGTCVRLCPVDPKAVQFDGQPDQPPVHNYTACIRCYCCQELCPEGAIHIETPLLGRLIRR